MGEYLFQYLVAFFVFACVVGAIVLAIWLFMSHTTIAVIGLAVVLLLIAVECVRGNIFE